MKPYSTDFRTKILETKKKTNESIQQTAERFQVSYSFVRKLLKRYEATGTVEPKSHGGGAQPKLNSEHMAVVTQLVEEDNDATLEQLRSRVCERTGVSVSVPTICRILQRLELTRKKKTLHASEAETQRVQKLRAEYWTTIGEVKLEDLVFIDETGVNLAMTRHHARAKKGKRAYGKRPDGRGKNVTIIGAIGLKGFLAGLTFPGWTDKNAFYTYVKEVLIPQLWSGACVVLDNLPAHKAAEIEEAIKAVGAKLVFLSPYSPDFNPIENCWSKLKEYLRAREARTYPELEQTITEALETITQKDIVGWFTHCCYYRSHN